MNPKTFQVRPNIIVSPGAMVNSDKRNFKKSKHRSKRCHKKLLKRFNGYEFVQKPGILASGNTYIVHPALRSEVERALR